MIKPTIKQERKTALKTFQVSLQNPGPFQCWYKPIMKKISGQRGRMNPRRLRCQEKGKR
jgi:hypothetical protein